MLANLPKDGAGWNWGVLLFEKKKKKILMIIKNRKSVWFKENKYIKYKKRSTEKKKSL